MKDDKLNVKGVNLGSWLVLEKWMNPAMFEGTEAEDEYWLAHDLIPEVYAERMKRHRKEYITERDFAAIAAMGLNAVRIPIPYFIWGDRMPFLGCLEELDYAFDWAERWGLKILIDLHTVPGSQNGFDNGGLCGVCKWAQSPEEVAFVLNLLEKLAERYGKREGLFGIQPLNEPITMALTGGRGWEESGLMNVYVPRDPEMAKGSAPISIEFLRQFYVDAYRRVRRHMSEDKYFVFHDAFDILAWKDFMQEEEFKNVILDTHMYMMSAVRQGYDPTVEGCMKAVEDVFEKNILEMRKYFPIITGEWCLSNGYADEMPDGEAKTEAYQVLARKQLDTWNQGNGFFYWSYKLIADERKVESWDLGNCVLQGWMPLNSLREN